MAETSTQNAPGMLVPAYGRGRRMPYAPGFERALRGRAHGWKPRKGSIAKIHPAKAKRMLAEAERSRRARNKGQVRAVQRMSS